MQNIYTDTDLHQNEIRNIVIHPSSAVPAGTPVEGQIYYDTNTHVLYFWDGTDWTLLESGGDAVVSVNGETGAVVLSQDEILDGTTYKQYSQAEKTKLAGIEAGADITDTTNVNAAGALMESEVDADIKTFTLPASTTISAFGATLVDDTSAAVAQSTLGLVIGTNVQAYDADLTTWAGITPAAGIGTFLATPSSANLKTAVTDETGLGALVFATSPTLVTPELGAATFASLTCSVAVETPLNITQTGAMTNPTMLIINDTTASNNTLYIRDNTNFAYTGTLLTLEMVNGSDSGVPLRIKNGGTGRSLSVEDGSGNAKFVVSPTGVGFFGVGPVAQRPHIADAAATTGSLQTALNAALDILEQFGLMAP